MAERLKPVRCGCGGEAVVCNPEPLYAPDVYRVECTNCFVVTPFYSTESAAIDVWNRAMSGVDKDINVPNKYEYHIDHTDCIWYWNGKGKCPSTCSQYRDGWNDAMNFIYKDGKGYSPYRRSEE